MLIQKQNFAEDTLNRVINSIFFFFGFISKVDKIHCQSLISRSNFASHKLLYSQAFPYYVLVNPVSNENYKHPCFLLYTDSEISVGICLRWMLTLKLKICHCWRQAVQNRFQTARLKYGQQRTKHLSCSHLSFIYWAALTRSMHSLILSYLYCKNTSVLGKEFLTPQKWVFALETEVYSLLW